MDPGIRRLAYQAICFKIRSFLSSTPVAAQSVSAQDRSVSEPDRAFLKPQQPNVPEKRPSPGETVATLNVIQHVLQKTPPGRDRKALHRAYFLVETYLNEECDSADDTPNVFESVESSQQTANSSNTTTSDKPPRTSAARISPRESSKNCYMCHYRTTEPHPLYRALCPPCGDFNIQQRELSDPAHLRLGGRTALVTDGRVNLGYHTALKLLRCGARVIVSTRYPRDAAARYEGEADYPDWSGRLRVVGADFRAAADAFGLARAVGAQLDRWGAARLDVLVNNAAQTLTDAREDEARAVLRERAIGQGKLGSGALVIDEGYAPRVRGIDPARPFDTSDASSFSATAAAIAGGAEEAEHEGETTAEHGTLITNPPKSSWMQTFDEIPYEDLISAHAVNTFVPLILMRELGKRMGIRPENHANVTDPTDVPGTSAQASGGRPEGYVINVSSREGLTEISPAAAAGTHVHTNMTKAALNMLTATEAARGWSARRVAVNSVDPGYMSAAPEVRARRAAAAAARRAKGVESEGGRREVDGEDHGCPIGWEDGAGRVLWPVAVGEREGRAVWGRFLKHYGVVGDRIGEDSIVHGG